MLDILDYKVVDSLAIVSEGALQPKFKIMADYFGGSRRISPFQEL